MFVAYSRPVGVFIVNDLEQQPMFVVGNSNLRVSPMKDMKCVRMLDLYVGKVVASVLWQVAEYEALGLDIHSELHIIFPEIGKRLTTNKRTSGLYRVAIIRWTI